MLKAEKDKWFYSVCIWKENGERFILNSDMNTGIATLPEAVSDAVEKLKTLLDSKQKR